MKIGYLFFFLLVSYNNFSMNITCKTVLHGMVLKQATSIQSCNDKDKNSIIKNDNECYYSIDDIPIFVKENCNDLPNCIDLSTDKTISTINMDDDITTFPLSSVKSINNGIFYYNSDNQYLKILSNQGTIANPQPSETTIFQEIKAVPCDIISFPISLSMPLKEQFNLCPLDKQVIPIITFTLSNPRGTAYGPPTSFSFLNTYKNNKNPFPHTTADCSFNIDIKYYTRKTASDNEKKLYNFLIKHSTKYYDYDGGEKNDLIRIYYISYQDTLGFFQTNPELIKDRTINSNNFIGNSLFKQDEQQFLQAMMIYNQCFYQLTFDSTNQEISDILPMNCSEMFDYSSEPIPVDPVSNNKLGITVNTNSKFRQSQLQKGIMEKLITSSFKTLGSTSNQLTPPINSDMIVNLTYNNKKYKVYGTIEQHSNYLSNDDTLQNRPYSNNFLGYNIININNINGSKDSIKEITDINKFISYNSLPPKDSTIPVRNRSKHVTISIDIFSKGITGKINIKNAKYDQKANQLTIITDNSGTEAYIDGKLLNKNGQYIKDVNPISPLEEIRGKITMKQIENWEQNIKAIQQTPQNYQSDDFHPLLEFDLILSKESQRFLKKYQINLTSIPCIAIEDFYKCQSSSDVSDIILQYDIDSKLYKLLFTSLNKPNNFCDNDPYIFTPFLILCKKNNVWNTPYNQLFLVISQTIDGKVYYKFPSMYSQKLVLDTINDKNFDKIFFSSKNYDIPIGFLVMDFIRLMVSIPIIFVLPKFIVKNFNDFILNKGNSVQSSHFFKTIKNIENIYGSLLIFHIMLSIASITMAFTISNNKYDKTLKYLSGIDMLSMLIYFFKIPVAVKNMITLRTCTAQNVKLIHFQSTRPGKIHINGDLQPSLAKNSQKDETFSIESIWRHICDSSKNILSTDFTENIMICNNSLSAMAMISYVLFYLSVTVKTGINILTIV